MAKGVRKVKAPCFVEVESLVDFARLVCALERVTLPMFGFEASGESVLAVQLDLFRGTPVLYYARCKGPGDFLGYRNTGGREFAELSFSTRDASNVYAPILGLEKIPEMFEKGFFGKGLKREKYISMQVKDIANLCKISLYKIMLDDVPLPLFAFPADGGWIIGTFSRLDDVDEVAVFFYATLSSRPAYSFVKYSSMNPEKTGLTDRVDEHGYVYGKVIRLVEKHPMVEI